MTPSYFDPVPAPSESQLQICVEDRSGASEREGNGCVAHRRPMQVEELVVPSDNSILEREEAQAASKIPRIAVLSINRRTAEIELESLRHQHCRGLHLETMGEDSGKSGCAGTLEVVEPPQKVLPFQRNAMVL